MSDKVIPYGKQEITDEDIQEVISTLKSDFITQGPKIAEFEKEFANYVGAKYAIAVSNGTTALHLSVLALGLEAGQRVITTPITFAASANAALYAGAEITLVDIDADDYNIDVDQLEELLNAHPKGTFNGVIPVAFGGNPVKLDQIKALADEFGLWVVEDACHAPGGSFIDSKGNDIKCGSGIYSQFSCFSFHPVKHIAAGEGGMITTSDEELYKKVMLLRTHGITKDPELLHENHGAWYYEMQELGYNYRLSDINAALGLSQLKRADVGVARRNEIAKKYASAFEGLSIKYQQVHEGNVNAYHLFVIEVEERKALYDHLKANNVFAQVHYIPLNLQPYFKSLGFQKGDCPVAENYYNHCISLPMYPSLTSEEQEKVIQLVTDFVRS